MRRERALLIKVNGKERIVGKLLTINGDWCFYREVSKNAHTKYFEPVKMGPVKKWINNIELVA